MIKIIKMRKSSYFVKLFIYLLINSFNGLTIQIKQSYTADKISLTHSLLRLTS